MKIKNTDLLTANFVLSEFSNQELDISLAFKINTLVAAMVPAVKVVETLRGKILETGVLKDESGEICYADDKKTLVTLTPEGSEKLAELLSLESEVTCEQLTQEELKLAGIKIKPAALRAIEWLIKN